MKTNLHSRFALIFMAFTSSIQGQVNPVELGRSSNIYTILTTGQNQIYANDTANFVAFIHRQDVTNWDGGSGLLRYDFSVDGGATFTNDIGPLNVNNTQVARYPQISGFNALNSNNPLDIKLPFSAPTINSASVWDGFVGGVSEVAAANPTVTENYYELGAGSYLPKSLCEGEPGEFWMIDFEYDGLSIGDSIRLYKGIYNDDNTMSWFKHTSIRPNYYTGFAGNSQKISPNIAFSPDGSAGWASFLGDLVGGNDSLFSPVFIHSENGGDSWNTPVEIDLNAIPYIGDYPTLAEELQSFWILDASGTPAGSGRASCAFDSDLTVDANGNPHLFIVVGNGSTTDNPLPAYSIYSGLVKIAIDVTSPDGGLTWQAQKVSPIYTFRGSFGVNNTTMDNQPQVSRTENGSHVFYSWADSDTTILGLGDSENSIPNLRIAGYRVSDGYRTCAKWITNGDDQWDGLALWQTMAPTVLTELNETTDYSLPIVMAEMLTNDDLAPCKFWYFGADATLNESDFIAAGEDLNLDSCYVICLGDPDPSFTYEVDEVECSFANTTDIVGDAIYVWDFGDGSTSTEVSPTHSYAAGGTYTVCLTAFDDCGADSNCVSVTIPSLTGLTESNFIDAVRLQPNPTSGLLSITVNDIDEILSIKVIDLAGSIHYSNNHRVVNGKIDIDLSALSPGVYTVMILASSDQMATKRLIKL